MTKKIIILAWACVTGLMLAHAADVVDRIVVTVNKHAILQSDWDDALRCEAILEGREPGSVSDAQRQATLDRLIDQELLREAMRNSTFVPPANEEITRHMQEVRRLYASADRWHATLAKWNLTEKELENRIRLQLSLLRMVDARLRPTINIDAKSIEGYYNQELLPQLRQSGGQKADLAEITPRIKELLTQQRMNQLLANWLQSLRAGSHIRTSSADSGSQAR